MRKAIRRALMRQQQLKPPGAFGGLHRAYLRVVHLRWEEAENVPTDSHMSWVEGCSKDSKSLALLVRPVFS